MRFQSIFKREKLNPEARRELRIQRAKPILDTFEKWLIVIRQGSRYRGLGKMKSKVATEHSKKISPV